MKRIFTYLFVAVLTLLGTTSWAQTTLESGKVYHFQNAHFTGRAITAVEGNNASVQAAATNKSDLKQQWYVTEDDGKYIFRNLSNARYLSQTGPSAWSLTETNTANSNKFEYIVAGGANNTIRSASFSTDGNAYMHIGSATQTNIQGWGSGSGGSQWTVTKIEYTDAEIKALLDAVPTTAEVAAYQLSLETLFADGACVTPKLGSLSEAQSSEAYEALPAGLQRMVDKVYGGNWAEATVAPADRPNGNNNTNHNLWTVADTWGSDYAKRFRVQMYEPYSIEGEVTSYLRTNAHCNMDNPTGIYANNGETVYIMVDGDIAEGAELWLAHQSGNGATQYYTNEAYTRLHKGLNRVTFTTDGCQMWINYLVHTYNADGATIADKFPENRKLSNYNPLKIHIEGGHINGFFNAIGDFCAADSGTENLWGDVDNDDDWNYYKARVALPTDFALLGHRQTLLFPFGSYNSGKGHFGVANADGGIEYALAYHLETVAKNSVPYTEDNVVKYKDAVLQTPNCYAGRGTGFGNYSDTYYPGMGLSTTNGKINIMIEAWDRIMYSELASMGVVSKSTMDKMNALYPRWTSEGTVAEIYDFNNASSLDGKTYQEFCQGIDYSEYFNHHGCGVGAGSGYMSGGWRVCNYHYNTMGSIIGAIANEAGPTWGPAHEIGHQHQAVFNLNGQTEVTNNFFSNVAVWYMGMGTSRVNGSEGSLESVLNAFNTEGNDLYTNNIWAITHLYYRLWLYYHLAGNNTQFWPRLFELCRREPIVNDGQISGETSLLRFYKHACDAAGEDLTEFFRAHGFFEIMENRLVGDYSNATYNVTQEQIDEAIAEIKEKQYPVNYAVLFINDGTSVTTKKHDGSTSRALWDNNPTAEFGSVNDFIDGDVSVLTNYTATVNADGSVSMSGGEGGVGFLILNEKGELVSFSNKSTFKLSNEALETIVSGKATILTVDTENKMVDAEVDITAMQKDVLGMLIDKAQAIVDKIDDTYTKIGYFKGAAIADLASALDYAKEVYDSSSGYEAAYDLLNAEYRKVLANNDAKIPFDASLTYIITNYGNPNQTMWVNSENTVRSEGGVDKTSNDARWVFEETTTAGVYKIHTLNNDYIPAVRQSASMTATTGQADSNALYTLEEVKDGVWAIKLSPADGYRNLHSSWNNVVGWETGADASRWYLTAVAANPVIANLTDLEVYINKTETLIDEVLGTVTYTKGTPLQLQTTTERDAYYLCSNAPEDSEGSISYLADGITGVNSNYFHTEWSSEPQSGTHYLAVYLGEDNTIERFTFSHTTRSGASSDFPKSVDVYGSNDGVTYKLIGSASGMPQSAGAAWEFDGVMLSSFKYLRFNYHANRGYWHMAEFDITPVTGFTATVNDTYSSTVDVDKVTAAMNAMLEGKAVANSFSPTTGDVAAKLAALQTAYNALYAQYEATINARKEMLATLVTATETLINQVGTVELAKEEKLTLTTANLYCNAPYTAQNNSDYSAAYVDNLTDGSKTTFLHTDYSGTVAAPHYLRVDLGSESTTTKFRFNYSTRDNGNNCPTTIVVEGCNEADGTYTEITTLTRAADGLPNPNQNTNGGVAEDFESSVISMSQAYRYVRFKVTGVEGGNATFFVISEFGFTIVENTITVSDSYKEYVSDDLLLTTVLATNSSKAMSTNELVTSVPMLDAQILDQQITKAALEKAMENKPALDKTELQTLYITASELYGKMTGGEFDYSPSALTDEMLTAANAALVAAQTQLDAQDTTQEAIEEVKGILQAAYDDLLAVENANIKGSESVTNLQTLVTQINEYLSSKTVDAEKAAITMQASNENKEFYIWARETDGGNGVANLLDKNADGTANTGTFYGTTWGGEYAEYYHYIEVDMGEALSIDQLLFDYTARADRDLPGERPNNIKILGSNNKSDYTEIAILSDGMPVGLGQLWAMTTPLDLGTRYRYVRFAVASTTSNQFHMSDFNIYLLHSKVLNDYNKPSEISISALLLALEMANDLIGRHYITAAECSSINDKLTALYTEAQEAFALDVTDHTSLNELIAEIEALIAQAAMVEGVQEVAAETEAVKNAVSTDAGRFMYEADYDAAMARLHTAYDELAKALVDRTALAELIEKMEALTEQIGTFNTAGVVNKITLQTTEPANPFYLWSNASDPQEGSIAHLVDGAKGDDQNFFHSDWHNSVRPEGYHYLEVDLGAESINKYSLMQFAYHTRMGAQNAFPDAITVMGSNYRSSYADLYTVNEGLPQVANEASPSIAFDSKGYRYLRFKITDTEKAFWHMAEFELNTTSSTAEVRDEYVAKGITNEYAAERYDVLLHAKTIYQSGITAEEVAAATAALQTAYDELSSKLIDRSALGELIDATKALKNSMYAAEVETLTLQNTDSTQPNYLYCNAPGESNSYTGDKLGVKALLDDNTENFLHTTYAGNGYADDKDHYLRVDLGAGNELSNFVFSYTGRSGYPELTPSKIVIEGCNEADGEYEKIAVLVNLPANTTANIYEVRGNGNAYRFIRFMVTATNGTGKYNNHPYFALSAFSVSKITGRTAELQSKYTPTLYIYSTETLLNETDATVTSAEEVYNKATLTKDEYDSALATLQAEYDKLAEAIEKYWCPVELTTDENAPVLYTINAPCRGNSKAWQYSLQNNNITIVDIDAANLYHLWYFVEGDEEHTVKIAPVMTPSYKLGAADFGNGANKVSAVAESSVDWSFAYVNDNYNFKPNGHSTYLSNFNGGSYALGFYDNADDGSYVSFTKVELENYGLARLTELSGNVYSTPVVVGTTVGSYADGDEYNTALEAANAMLTAATSTPAEYVAAFTRLFNAYNALAINMPDPEKLYVLRCNHESRYIYVNADNKMQWAASTYDKALSNAVWSFEEVDADAGTFKMKSLHTQSYLSGLSGSQWAFGNEENGKVVTLVKSPSVDGAIIFKIEGNGDNGLHAHGSDNTVINYTNAAGANHYFFEEVEDVETIKYATTMSNVGYSTLMLGFDATIPEGITAYTADVENGVQGKYLQLLEVEGGVLPANTAVILKSNETLTENKPLEFYYAGNDADAINGNMFDGSLYNTVIDGVSTKIYQLQSKSGAVKLYWMYAEYSEDGTIADGNKNTDNGGYVKLPANRTYLSLSKSLGASSYTFRFDWNGTTDIDAVTTGEGVLSGTIFDLQGRKLECVTAPGFYIVNGKKVYVREIE